MTGYVRDLNGHDAPLIDSIGKKDVARDFADDDVRNAMREVGARENRERIASDLGLDGVSAAEAWDQRISQIGPNAALEAAQLYASAPRPSAKAEEERDEPDHMRTVRAAFRAVAEKESRQATMPAALAGINRLEQRHGSLGLVDKFRKWDEQLRANPADAAPRVAREIADTVNESLEMQQAHQTLQNYQARHKISDDERALMSRMLRGGEAYDLPTAHAMARHELALEIKDPWEREVVAAQRAAEAVPMYFARLEVDNWRRRNPGVSGAIEARMQKLLEAGKAQNMDEAYALARR